MKKKIKAIIAMMLTAMLMLTLCGCSNNKEEIEGLMSRFEDACNEMDTDAVLECIDPNISDKIRLATGIAGVFAGKESADLTKELAGMLTDDNSLNADEFFSSIKVEISDIKTKKEMGTANALVEYTVAGEKFKKEATFEYIHNTEKWYISGFSFK